MTSCTQFSVGLSAPSSRISRACSSALVTKQNTCRRHISGQDRVRNSVKIRRDKTRQDKKPYRRLLQHRLPEPRLLYLQDDGYLTADIHVILAASVSDGAHERLEAGELLLSLLVLRQGGLRHILSSSHREQRPGRHHNARRRVRRPR